MGQEIERKFLVEGEYKSQAYAHSRIVQGYICSTRGRTVRVRIRGTKGYLTIKGASDATGLSRYEWEKEITAEDAVTSDTSKATEKFSASPEPPSDGSLLHDIIASDSNDAKNKNFFICLISVRKQVSDGLSTPLSGSVPQLILNRIVYEYNMPAQEYCRQR